MKIFAMSINSTLNKYYFACMYYNKQRNKNRKIDREKESERYRRELPYKQRYINRIMASSGC